MGCHEIDELDVDLDVVAGCRLLVAPPRDEGANLAYGGVPPSRWERSPTRASLLSVSQ
jgi:hypothetical protein